MSYIAVRTAQFAATPPALQIARFARRAAQATTQPAVDKLPWTMAARFLFPAARRTESFVGSSRLKQCGLKPVVPPVKSAATRPRTLAVRSIRLAAMTLLASHNVVVRVSNAPSMVVARQVS